MAFAMASFEKPRRRSKAPPLPDTAVKSAVRVLRVFEYFRENPGPARALTIAETLSLAPSSAADLLKTLMAEGYLYFDAAKKTYYPTPRVATLSRWLDESDPYFAALLTLMRRLNREIGCASTLSYRNRFTVQFCCIVQSPYTASINLVEGAQLPLLETAAGLALLMALRDEEIAGIAGAVGRARGEAETGVASLEEVRRCRAVGYAVKRGGYWEDNCGIAIPLPRLPGNARAALCVGGPIDHLAGREAAIAGHMRDALQRHLPAPAAFA